MIEWGGACCPSLPPSSRPIWIPSLSGPPLKTAYTHPTKLMISISSTKKPVNCISSSNSCSLRQKFPTQSQISTHLDADDDVEKLLLDRDAHIHYTHIQKKHLNPCDTTKKLQKTSKKLRSERLFFCDISLPPEPHPLSFVFNWRMIKNQVWLLLLLYVLHLLMVSAPFSEMMKLGHVFKKVGLPQLKTKKKMIHVAPPWFIRIMIIILY